MSRPRWAGAYCRMQDNGDVLPSVISPPLRTSFQAPVSPLSCRCARPRRYDGEVFVKPPEVLMRDRLLGSYEVGGGCGDLVGPGGALVDLVWTWWGPWGAAKGLQHCRASGQRLGAWARAVVECYYDISICRKILGDSYDSSMAGVHMLACAPCACHLTLRPTPGGGHAGQAMQAMRVYHTTPPPDLPLFSHPQVKPVLGKLRTTLLGSGAALLTAAVLLFGLIRAGSDADGMYGGCRGAWRDNVLPWGGEGRFALPSRLPCQSVHRIESEKGARHAARILALGSMWDCALPLRGRSGGVRRRDACSAARQRAAEVWSCHGSMSSFLGPKSKPN